MLSIAVKYNINHHISSEIDVNVLNEHLRGDCQ